MLIYHKYPFHDGQVPQAGTKHLQVYVRMLRRSAQGGTSLVGCAIETVGKGDLRARDGGEVGDEKHV
jgi:hypothetical protein